MTNFRIDQPVRASIQRLMARHPERLLDTEQPVGVDHELRRDRSAVGAGRQVGDVSLQPGQGCGQRFLTQEEFSNNDFVITGGGCVQCAKDEA